MATSIWRKFACTRSQLCLDTVLIGGQSFRWKKNCHGEWLGVMAGLVWRMKQTDDHIHYQVYGRQDHCSQDLCKECDNDLYKNSRILTWNKDIDSKIAKNISSKADFVDGIKLGSQIKSEDCKSIHTDDISPRYQPEKSATKTKGLQKRRGANDTKDSKHRKMQSDINIMESVNGSAADDGDKMDHNEDGLPADSKSEVLQRLPQSYNTGSVMFADTQTDYHKLLHNYFQLDVDLDKFYKFWSSKDPHFCKVAGSFRGIRMLRQDPVENLISFVCSSNNHISRISSMVEKLCTHYGEYVAKVDGEDYYAFPPLSALCGDDVETRLRELGFGYRAKFIAHIAKHVVNEREEGWVESLRHRSYEEAKKELMTLMGVGAKVADCVCLMSLDKAEAVPVDTHVWQITMKNYMAKLNSAKSLTEKLYNEIGDFYRNLWGPYAGWAHSVLFTADLRHNKNRGQDTAETKVPNDKAATSTPVKKRSAQVSKPKAERTRQKKMKT